MNAHTLTNAMQLFPVLLIGFLLPWLGRTRPGLLFGVTVPLDLASSPQAVSALRRYRLCTLATVAGIIVAALLFLGSGKPRPAIAPTAIAIELAAAMVFWQRERRVMRAYAIVVPLERSAGLAPSRHAGTMLTTAAALLPLAVTGLWLLTHWAQIPARWPQHWDYAGQVNGWGVRTVAGVSFPLIMGASVVALFLTIVAFMAYAPGTQSRQRERVLAPMAALAWSTALLFSTIAFLPLLHLATAAPIAVLIVLHVVSIFGILIWMIVRCGFMATGIAAQPAAEPYDGTEDRFWHGGLFYYNPADAAVLVPKRYGWGWTLNFARPAAWAFTLMVIGVALLSAWLPRLLR